MTTNNARRRWGPSTDSAQFIWQLGDASAAQVLIPPAASDRARWDQLVRMADELTAAGSGVTLREARQFALDRVAEDGTLKPISAARMLPFWHRFELYAENRDGIRLVNEITQECVVAFIEARGIRGSRPGTSTMALRRTSLRTWFRILRRAGLMIGDVTLDMEPQRADQNHARGLTDDEMERVRTSATSTLFTDRPALSVALLEAGASTLDLRAITVGDVDLPNRRAWIHGGLKGWPRWTSLTEWGVGVLGDRVALQDTAAPVLDLYDLTDHSARMGVSMALHRTFRRAGIDATEQVRSRSIGIWAANRILADTGNLQDAARHLGLQSLDRTAKILGYDWRGVT